MAIECKATSIGLVCDGIFDIMCAISLLHYMFHFLFFCALPFYVCTNTYFRTMACRLVTHRINVDVSFGILPRLCHWASSQIFFLALIEEWEKIGRGRVRELFSKIKIFFSTFICQKHAQSHRNSTPNGKVWKRKLKAILFRWRVMWKHLKWNSILSSVCT